MAPNPPSNMRLLDEPTQRRRSTPAHRAPDVAKPPVASAIECRNARPPRLKR